MKNTNKQDSCKVKVTPLNKKLSGTSTIWEYYLFNLGWNDLPEEDKFGIIQEANYIDNKKDHMVFIVYFPVFNWTSPPIFLDEIALFKL